MAGTFSPDGDPARLAYPAAIAMWAPQAAWPGGGRIRSGVQDRTVVVWVAEP
jgi:hypothetical protein